MGLEKSIKSGKEYRIEYGTKGQSLFEPIDGLKRKCSLYENDFLNMKGSCHCVDY